MGVDYAPLPPKRAVLSIVKSVTNVNGDLCSSHSSCHNATVCSRFTAPNLKVNFAFQKSALLRNFIVFIPAAKSSSQSPVLVILRDFGSYLPQ